MRDNSYYSSLPDNVLVENVKTRSCNDSLKEIISRHSGICYAMGKRFSNNSSFDMNDLTDNKDWVIYTAVLSFDVNKGSKFSTWLANQVKFYCLNLKNKTSKYVNTEADTIEFLINQYNSLNEGRMNKKEILNTIKDLLHQIKDDNIKKAVHYRYFYSEDKILNYSEIGEILHVTPQTVLNWHNKFINLAKKKLTSKSIIDKI